MNRHSELDDIKILKQNLNASLNLGTYSFIDRYVRFMKGMLNTLVLISVSVPCTAQKSIGEG